MDYIWCCLSNIYGVGNTTNNFVNMASRKMLQGMRAAFTSGEQMYDFMYITDAARALVYAALKGKSATDYFLGSTQPRKLKDYIIQIRNSIDPEIPIYLGEVPFYGIPLSDDAFSADKLVADTGFSVGIPFEQGIGMTIDWLKKVDTL
jgi:nucleoside-diphosphate-sugar epimerase